MRDAVTLRPALPADLPYCREVYYEAMRPTIERLFGWDAARQDARFERQWAVEEVAIILDGGADIGWMQTADADGAIFLKQIYVEAPSRNRQIGTHILWSVLDQAKRHGLAVTLGVMKDNPARRLYERLGFRPTHEDMRKIYLRCSPGV